MEPITVCDTCTSPGAQSNEAIYLDDSPLNTPESLNSTPEHSNNISLVGYTENIIPRSLINQFANQGSGSTNQSAGALHQIVGSNSESIPQPTASQTPLIPVNADVLEQVVKLAAFGWEKLNPENGSRQQHVVDLYQLLTNSEASLGEPVYLQGSLCV